MLAVVHVGSLSGVACNTSPTSQQEPTNSTNKYELYGAAVDVCRQIMADTVASVTELFAIKVTKDAVDAYGGCGSKSLTLVPDSTIFTVSLN